MQSDRDKKKEKEWKDIGMWLFLIINLSNATCTYYTWNYFQRIHVSGSYFCQPTTYLLAVATISFTQDNKFVYLAIFFTLFIFVGRRLSYYDKIYAGKSDVIYLAICASHTYYIHILGIEEENIAPNKFNKKFVGLW